MRMKKYMMYYRVTAGCFLHCLICTGIAGTMSVALPLMPTYYNTNLTVISAAVSVSAIVAFLCSLIANCVFQKISLRLCVGYGALAYLIFGVLIFCVHHIVAFYLGYFLMGTVTAFSLFGATTAIIGNWFYQKREIMLGIVLAGGMLGSSVFQFIGGICFEKFGYRQGYLLITSVSAVVLFVNTLLMIRDKPENLGMSPYGNLENDITHEKQNDDFSDKNKMLYRNPAFWLVLLGSATGIEAVTLISAYAPTFFLMNGNTYTTSASLSSIMTLSAGLFAFYSGRVLEKVGIRKFVVIMFGFAGLCNVCMAGYAASKNWMMIPILLFCYMIGNSVTSLNNYIAEPLFGKKYGTNANTKMIAVEQGANCLLFPLWTNLIEKFGFIFTYIAVAVSCLLTAAIFLLAIRITVKRQMGKGIKV